MFTAGETRLFSVGKEKFFVKTEYFLLLYTTSFKAPKRLSTISEEKIISQVIIS